MASDDDRDCLSECECGCECGHDCSPIPHIVAERIAGGFIDENGAPYKVPGDFALGQTVIIGCHGEAPHGRLPVQLPPVIPRPRRRFTKKAATIPFRYPKRWPVRHIEKNVGSLHELEDGDLETGWISDHARMNWVAAPHVLAAPNTLRALRIDPLALYGNSNSWVSDDGLLYMGDDTQAFLAPRIMELEIEKTWKGAYPRTILDATVSLGTLFKLTADKAGMEYAVISAYYDIRDPNPFAGIPIIEPGIIGIEPPVAYAVEILENGWKVYARTIVENVSWSRDWNAGGRVDSVLRLDDSISTVTLDFSGNVIANSTQSLGTVAQVQVSSERGNPGPAYLAAKAGRLATLRAWLDGLEIPEVDMVTPIPDAAQGQVQPSGPAEKIGPFWRIPLQDVTPLLFAGDAGSIPPKIAGQPVVFLTTNSAWVQGGNPVTDPSAPLPVQNPGYANVRRVGIRPRNAPPVDSYFATPARNVIQVQPSTVQLINFSTYETSSPDLSAPWYANGEKKGDGFWQIDFQLPQEGWDYWALMIREAKSDAPTTLYTPEKTAVNTNMGNGQETLDQLADWHYQQINPDSQMTPNSQMTVKINFQHGFALAGITLLLLKKADDMT